MRIKKNFSLIMTVLVVLSFFSCTTTESGPPVSTGRNAEILITSTKSIWESQTGDSIRMIFSQPMEGLNQIEPMFRFLYLEELNDLFKKHRNILRIVIDSSVEEAVLQYSDNVFAKPQTYVEAIAPNSTELIKLLKKGEKALFEKFRKTDFARIQTAYSRQTNPAMQNQIQNQIGVRLSLPSSFFIAKQTPDFAWLRLETSKYSQGLMIYRREFTDSMMLQPDFVRAWKNTVTRVHIPGQMEGSYMMTDTLTQPSFRWIDHKAGKALEMRGLWITMGDFMGGPFVSFFMIDPAQKYLYAFDSYVYYPSQDKRDLVLQLEAIMHSAEFK